MVVGVGGAAMSGKQQAGAGRAGPSRREAARGLLASVAALALAPVVAASRPAPAAEDPGATSFDEIYRGRHISGVLIPAGSWRATGRDWRITIDGRPLHLMRRADDTWLSMVDHYTSYRTPLEAARAVVDEIGPDRRLRDLATGPVGDPYTGHLTMGGQHGVRA
ncbi:tyrosinase family oxidase copper chaperone [Streptomyces sp. AF1A]|jgi:hypothetical protein|uniref:tyrosinase family oxidase copper chaperone n=1 Tax=Streptomyces sp. AF1A TaxID=3394350 RepID=UPI0039BD2DCC